MDLRVPSAFQLPGGPLPFPAPSPPPPEMHSAASRSQGGEPSRVKRWDRTKRLALHPALVPRPYLPRFPAALKRAHQAISGPTGWPGVLGVRGHWLEVTILGFGLPPALGWQLLTIHPRGNSAGDEGGLAPTNGEGLVRYPFYPWARGHTSGDCPQQPFLTRERAETLEEPQRDSRGLEGGRTLPKLPESTMLADGWQTWSHTTHPACPS